MYLNIHMLSCLKSFPESLGMKTNKEATAVIQRGMVKALMRYAAVEM